MMTVFPFLRYFYFFVALYCLLVPVSFASATKRLIQFGWNVPDSDYLVANSQMFETSPFDGVVFEALIKDANSLATTRLSDQIFQQVPLEWEGVSESASKVASLRSKVFQKLLHNIVRVNLAPLEIDWFDDFSIPLANARVVSRYVATSGIKGIFFDIEQYGSRSFEFDRPLRTAGKTFAEYEARVRELGRKLMLSLSSQSPDLVLFMPFLFEQMNDTRNSNEHRKYELLPAFIDGLFEAAPRGVTIVNCLQLSYRWNNAVMIETARTIHLKENLAHTSVPAAYRRALRSGLSVWLDYENSTHAWNYLNVDNNYFSPPTIRRLVPLFLRESDEYVIIYSQNVRWWSKRNIPAAYSEVFRTIRETSLNSLRRRR